MSPLLSAQKRNIERKHERIREQYEKRYTNAARPRKYTREYIVSQLALEFYLSMSTIEDIIYSKPVAVDEQQPQALKQAA